MRSNLSKLKRHKASSAIEFLVVFVVLYTLFFTVIDIGLYFRQVYNVQTVSDEALSWLLLKNTCSAPDGLDDVEDALSEVIRSYYNVTPAFNMTSSGNTFSYTNGDNYTFNVVCRNSQMPQKVMFAYKYKGIFMYRDGVMIHSTPSINTSYF